MRPRANVTIDSLKTVVYEKSMVPKWITLTFVQRSYEGHVNHCATFAVEYLGNRCCDLIPKEYGVSNGHVTYDVMWPWKVKLLTPVHLEPNISKTAGDKDCSKWLPIGNGIWGIKWPRDRQRHVTPKGQTRDPNTLRAKYLENSWRCCLATIANYCYCCTFILATAWLLVFVCEAQ